MCVFVKVIRTERGRGFRDIAAAKKREKKKENRNMRKWSRIQPNICVCVHVCVRAYVCVAGALLRELSWPQ